ncbi:MAG: AEC family transporter [Clostridium sp.]|nr:AEC family transporter [Clostridium sp.]
MAGMINAFFACLVLLMIMGVGYGMGCLGWMTAAEKKFISNFLVYIAVPCNCITGLLDNLDHSGLAAAGVMLVSAFLNIAVTLGVSVLAAKVLRLPRERWGVFVSMAAFSNALFIGIPVCTQLFGQACIPHLMVYYVANTSYVQSAALMLIQRSGTVTGERVGVAGFFRDLFSKPPILGVLAGMGMLAADVRPPEFFMRFAGYVGDTVTPLALIYCGYVVYEQGLHNLRLMRGLPTMLAIRLMISPAICFLFCCLFGITGLARDVFVVESALPVVSQVTVLAGAFGADEKYAATGATLSTLGCIFTIPVLMLLLGG